MRGGALRKNTAILGVEWRWLIASATYSLGLYCGFCAWECSPLIIFPIAALIFTILLGIGFSLKLWWTLAIFLFGIVIALREVDLRRSILEESHGWNSNSPITLDMYILEDAKLYFAKNGSRCVKFRSSVNGMIFNVSGKSPDNGTLPRKGETWRCRGWIAGWGDNDIFAKRDFWIRGEGCKIEKLSDGWGGLYLFLAYVKSNIAERLEIGLDEKSPGKNFLRAIIIGEKFAIPKESQEVFVASGVIHIFAISGLHVMLFVKLLFLTFGMFLPFVRLKICLLLPIVWLYAMMVNLPASALRAAMMISCYYLSFIFLRRPNAIISWALTFLTCHFFKPELLFDVGSLLSFTVMFSIINCSRFLAGFSYSKLVSALAISTSSWLVGVPIIAVFFSRITFAGLYSSLFAVPAATCAVALGFVGVIFSFVSTKIASYANNLAALILEIVSNLCELIIRIPWSQIEIINWNLFQSISWYVCLAMIFLYFGTRREIKI